MENLGVALIGSGYIAHYHARALQQQSGVLLRALCSLDGQTAPGFAKQYSIPEVTDTIAGLLARSDIQAAVICTPNAFHAPYALAFMEHGQHVIVEKPMALNTAECRQMSQLATDHQVCLMVGHMWRFDADVNAIRDVVQAGTLGDMVKTKGYGIHVNWGPDGWFTRRALAGGGALIDMGVHAIDTVRYVLGDPSPKEVYARLSTAYGDYDVDDTGLVVITWDTGTVSVIESGWWHAHADGPEASTQFFGTQGYASVFPTLYKVKAGDAMEEIVPDLPVRKEHCDQIMYTRQMQSFIECVRQGKAPSPGSSEGRIVMEIVDAAYESARTGKVIDV
jgi:predicted dehydrogenase